MTKSSLARRALLALCAACWLGTPAFAETVSGSGNVKTQTRAATGFTSVGLSIPAKVEVRMGNAEGVTIEADENLLPLIETTVKRGSLEIKPVRDRLHLSSKSIRIVVQAKEIEQLDIGGSGSITADALRAKSLKLVIGGSGAIDIRRLDADKVGISIGGSGDVTLSGAVRRVDATVAGSGDIAAAKLLADEARVTIAGSGDATVAARNKLDVTIAGSGSIDYWGDPQVSRTILGAGSIKRLGPLPQ